MADPNGNRENADRDSALQNVLVVEPTGFTNVIYDG